MFLRGRKWFAALQPRLTLVVAITIIIITVAAAVGRLTSSYSPLTMYAYGRGIFANTRPKPSISQLPRSKLVKQVTVLLFLWLCALVHPLTSQCLTENDKGVGMKISEKDRLALLKSQLDFSVDLLHALNNIQTDDNILLSPSSVYNALLLAYFISANQTEKALKQTLRIPDDQDKLETYWAYSTEKYNQKMKAIRSALKYQLSNANRIYVSTDHKVRQCMDKQFSDEIEMADFKKNISATVTSINKWVSGQTRNNINDLLAPNSLNDNTNLVLVNAAFFRGLWVNQFSPNETRESDFILANGTKVPIMMMSLESKFNHHMEEELDVEVLEMPYEGDDISMFILLPLTPSVTAIKDLLNKTTAKTIQDIVKNSALAVGGVSIAIPKFSVDKSMELTPVLESMGVGDLFGSSADLSTLTGSSGLRLDSAIHKAKISVDEAGTVAAAATAIFANRFAADSFVANHPFVYFLYDKKSNTLLFAGIFNTPET